MPDLCTVTGTLITPDGVVVADARVDLAPTGLSPRPASASKTLLPATVTVQTGPAGEVAVDLVPGRYVVRASGYRTFFVTVPDAPFAVLAQIQDLPPAPSLTDAQMAVIAAEAARDEANAAAQQAQDAIGVAVGVRWGDRLVRWESMA